MSAMQVAVSFDFGQTLAALDHEFLKRRLAAQGTAYDSMAGYAETAAAWSVYGQKKSDGHSAAWRAMIETMLLGGGVPPERLAELGAWLWLEQPRQNLWRRPIAGMIELVRELRAAGLRVGVISNSEGRLFELTEELGWSADFDVIVDSGRLGIDKPDPRIFLHACAALGIGPTELIHVGDAWEADVEGALGVSARAIWFDQGRQLRALPEHVQRAADATEVRAALARYGIVLE